MTTGALVAGGGARTGERRSAVDTRVDSSPPPWRKWRTRSRAARAIRFIETYCRIPSGHNAGELMRLHRFQKESLEELLAPGVRTGGLQIPRGNAKSTLGAALGLWAVCDHPDEPQVPLVALNGLQAMRNLMAPLRSFARGHDELRRRVVAYTSTTDRRVWSAWNNGNALVLPADPERLQGLNPTVALVDEAELVGPDVFGAVLQGAGKRAASLVLAIGTPAPGRQDSALFAQRERARDGAALAWVEYAAPDGCALDDRAAWHKANPALRAGLLSVDVLAEEAAGSVSEVEFRMYRLGQWIDATVATWLPAGAWDACPHADAPPDDAPIVLGLAGTYTDNTVSLVGATPDGAVFVAWAGDAVTDDRLEEVLTAADQRWQVLELVVAPRIRPAFVRRLTDAGYPVHVWENTNDLEAKSATEWRRAIVETRMAHDHDPLLGEHVAALVARPTTDGTLRLGAPDERTPIDAARAARMAWWRALELEDSGGAPVIY